MHVTPDDTKKLATQMVDALRAERCRSRELFQKLKIDDRTGREALSLLIDTGRVIVETDWVLRARDSSIPEYLRVGRCFHAHPTHPHGYTGCRLPPKHAGECRWSRLLNLCKHREGWRPCNDILDCPVDHDPGDEDQDSR